MLMMTYHFRNFRVNKSVDTQTDDELAHAEVLETDYTKVDLTMISIPPNEQDSRVIPINDLMN